MLFTEEFDLVAHYSISKQGKIFANSFKRQAKHIDVPFIICESNIRSKRNYIKIIEAKLPKMLRLTRWYIHFLTEIINKNKR